jgi:protein ImuB
MCVWLKQWPIDRIRRKQKQSRRDFPVSPFSQRACSPPPPDAPLILVKTIASRQVVIAMCDQARSHSITNGMTLAEARALCTTVEHVEHQPAADAKALERLARWMMRFSPLVAIEPPDTIVLDVTGSTRLFNSFEQLMQLASGAITRLGFHHGIAIAPTLGAAWAMASFGCSKGAPSVRPLHGLEEESCRLLEILAPLPIAALRLEEELLLTLGSLGIETIGQLANLPRQTLPARFGASVLLRLDQALGNVDEPLVGIAHREPIDEKIEFEAAIDSLEMIEEGLRLLIGQIIRHLQRYGCGARKVIVDFLLPPHGKSAIQKIIHLSRASCDRSGLFNLIRCAAESAKSEDGFIGLRLSVPVYERIAQVQIGLMDGEEEASAEEYETLVERLRARMGKGSVLLPRLAESHLPERACAYADAIDENSATTTSTFTATAIAATAILPRVALEKHQAKSRPLHLLPEPREVRCMVSPGGAPISFSDGLRGFDLKQVRGPERITGIWWEGRDKTRDYFDVEDAGGRRFWIFRVLENRRWFLHGVFDC